MAGTLRFGVRLGAIVLVAAMTSACTGRYESDFPVIVVNRTANPIQALADGKAIGLVDPGQTQSFSLELPESNPNIFVNGTAPTPRADVTFTARDTKTGALSAEKNVTLPKGLDSKDQALYERLSKLSGQQFDKTYMSEMVKDHKADIAEFQKATHSNDPQVKDFASKTLPTLEDHLREAQQIASATESHKGK